MINSTIDYTVEKFLIDDKPVMISAMDVLQILNQINKITIIGKGESCPATVSVANIITQNILKGRSKTDKIFVDSEILDDGRLISTIEILISKIDNQ
tara:strand:- start:188 stop:478 length:291 start_codon:yes stop_codon:yes gene_type:complete